MSAVGHIKICLLAVLSYTAMYSQSPPTPYHLILESDLDIEKVYQDNFIVFHGDSIDRNWSWSAADCELARLWYGGYSRSDSIFIVRADTIFFEAPCCPKKWTILENVEIPSMGNGTLYDLKFSSETGPQDPYSLCYSFLSENDTLGPIDCRLLSFSRDSVRARISYKKSVHSCTKQKAKWSRDKFDITVSRQDVIGVFSRRKR